MRQTAQNGAPLYCSALFIRHHALCWELHSSTVICRDVRFLVCHLAFYVDALVVCSTRCDATKFNSIGQNGAPVAHNKQILRHKCFAWINRNIGQNVHDQDWQYACRDRMPATFLLLPFHHGNGRQ